MAYLKCYLLLLLLCLHLTRCSSVFKVEGFFSSLNSQANVGEELESEKYLITIEELKQADTSSEHTPAPQERAPQRTSAPERNNGYPLSNQPPLQSQASKNQPMKRKRMVWLLL